MSDGEDKALREWPFRFEQTLHELVPSLQQAQSSWMAAIDSLREPDRKTHELIRMVCLVILRNPEGVQHHARLATEVGASWEEIVGSILLTEPSFGILRAVEALAPARKGYKEGLGGATGGHQGS